MATATFTPPVPVEGVVHLELSEREALHLLAVCAKIGGAATTNGEPSIRGTFSDLPTSIGKVLGKALGLSDVTALAKLRREGYSIKGSIKANHPNDPLYDGPDSEWD
jgi:hypothetical protein